MSAALPLLLVLSLSPGESAAERPAWCEEVAAFLEGAPATGDEAWPRYLAIASRLPAQAEPLLEEARRRAGTGGSLDETLRLLALALDDGCRTPALVTGPSAAEQVRDILARDERFEGKRPERSLADEWRARFAAWLTELFESELMRTYAGASRAIYLTALALFVAFVSLRLWRARVKERSSSSNAAEQGALLERERQLAFAEHRREAELCLEDGDLRGALRAGQLALLARIGEVDARALTPARTNREVLRSLDESRRAIVAPPLARFERAFYGGAALDVDFVRAFLSSIDAAARALGGEP